jgi:hypothetical protein
MHKQPSSEEEQQHKQVERLLTESRQLRAESLQLSEGLQKTLQQLQQLQDSFYLMSVKDPHWNTFTYLSRCGLFGHCSTRSA